MRRKPIALAALAAAGIALAVLGTLRGWWNLHPTAALRYEYWGVDVSDHQGAIDWAQVATVSRVHFAYVKATEGGDFTDPRFEENWREARRAGLRVGVYHFLSFCRPAVEQARPFLSIAPRDPGALPPALDLELGGNCSVRPEFEVVLREVGTWMSEVERALGQRPVLYLTMESYDLFVRGQAIDRPLWVRDVLSEPSLDPAPAWAIWQFWPRGRVDGIDGAVDLNALQGADALARRCGRRPRPER